MFKIQRKVLFNRAFWASLNKIANCPDFKDFKLAYNISRLVTILERLSKQNHKDWQEFGKSYLKKDDKGMFINAGEWFVPSEESGLSQEQADKKTEEFMDQELQVDRIKFKPEDLMAAKPSPADFTLLDPILHPVLESV